MKFIRWLPLGLLGFSSFAWAKEPGPAGSHGAAVAPGHAAAAPSARHAAAPPGRPAAGPPGRPAASGAEEFAKPPAADASGRYARGAGAANPSPTVWQSAVGDLADRIQRHELKREELPARYAELEKSRVARRVARLEALKAEAGPALFGRAEYQKELARHHRAVAFLERARLVAESDVEGMRRAQALARIQVMQYEEGERHVAAVAALKGVAPAPSAAPRASGAAPKASAP